MEGLCKNCGADMMGEYCHVCGEKVLSDTDFHVSRYVGGFVSSLTNLDNKFYRTVKAFLGRPGQLSRHYFDGLRKPYLSPVQIFLIMTIVFYVLAPDFDLFYIPAKWFFSNINSDSASLVNQLALEKMAALDLSRSEFFLKYDISVKNYSKAFLFLAIPFVAFGSFLSRPRAVPQFGKHLIFATYTFSFFILWFFLLLFIAFKLPSHYTPDSLMRILSFGGGLLYFILANRRAWGDGWFRASFAGFFQAFMVVLFILFYRSGISLATLFFL